MTDLLSPRSYGEALSHLHSAVWDRVYLGSSFCCRYLLGQPHKLFEELAEACACRGVLVTLVLPIANEGQLDGLIEFADTLLDAFGGTIDELTCNDLGMLACASRRHPGIRLNAGRLLNKDTREPREPYYPDLVWEPSVVSRGVREAFPSCRVAGVELDPVHRVLDLSRADDSLTYALYADMCYITTGHICEAASLGKPLTSKYRPDDVCAFLCLDHAVAYSPSDSADQAPTFYRVGRTLYYVQSGACCIGAGIYRLIHSPLLLEACGLA